MRYSDFPIKKIALTDSNYPSILKKIKNPPAQLFYRGKNSQKIFEKTLAVVGSRRATSYGQKVLDLLIPPLVAEGVAIISGFMYGIDSLAHQKCLEADGKTIAVFGCGLDIVYPPENEKLYTQILESGGLVFSEYPSSSKPHLFTFPQRNRIVVGLSNLGVLIVEAGEKSGSLISARLAQQQGKKVFAVPGPITSSNCAGTNWLIKQKLARMVMSAEDILGKKKAFTLGKKEAKIELGPIEEKIFLTLSSEDTLTVDEISKILKKNAAETGQILTLMNLKGLVEEAGGKYFLKQ